MTETAERVQLKVDDLLERARKQAVLSDFGDDWFLTPLGKVIELINTEADLVSADASPVQLMIGYLIDRLRLVDYLKRHPEVLDEPVEVAGFIIGWPRGGSTLLQRLLASSPQLASAQWWELLTPLPLEGEAPGDFEARQKIAFDTAEAYYEAWPAMRSMHPLKPLDADEEILLFDRTFMSLMWSHYFYIPSFMTWMQSQDHTKVYEEVLLWLRVLTHQQPERRGKKWILKSPQHLLGGGLRDAFRAMPGAKAIMTHRSLQNVATSYASIQETTLENWSAAMDRRKLGRDAIHLFGQCVDHLKDVRSEPAFEKRFIDVHFKDTVEQPIEVFSRVMGQMGFEVTEDDLAAARAWMAANGRETHPPHKYAPEDYDMTGAEIDRIFAEYHQRYV